MKFERTQNAIKNIQSGLALKIYQIIVPFFMRTAMLYFMGIQYLGLNSLFASVLQVLNLAELGVGAAIVFAMYKPIAHDDEETICALMGLYRRFYRIIGTIIAVVGLLLTPVIPLLISGDIPKELNVYVLYFLNLGATVLTYWLFAYKNCLLQAHQRADIASKITAITYTVQCVVQLVVLLVFKNYYFYVIAQLAAQALNNVITAIAVDRKYPNYRAAGKLSKEKNMEVNQKIRDIFTGKIGAVVLRSADTIVISAFLGLSMLAIYQNYFFILSSIIAVIEIILSSITAGLGNSYVSESKEKNYKDLEKFTFLFLWLTGVCTCCFLGMYQPFMKIWTDKPLMLEFDAVVCFSAYFFVYTLNRLLSTYKDAAGLWHEDRFRPLITAIINLILNIWWVNIWGIYGVLLSTVVSMVLIGMPWLIHNLFTLFFDKKSMKKYIRQLFCHILVTALAGTIVCLICAQIHGFNWPKFLLCTLTSVFVPNVLFLIFLRKHEQFRPALRFLDRITKNKMELDRRFFPKG